MSMQAEIIIRGLNGVPVADLPRTIADQLRFIADKIQQCVPTPQIEDICEADTGLEVSIGLPYSLGLS